MLVAKNNHPMAATMLLMYDPSSRISSADVEWPLMGIRAPINFLRGSNTSARVNLLRFMRSTKRRKEKRAG